MRRAAVLDEGLMFDPEVHLVRTSANGIGCYNFCYIIDRILAKPKSDGSTQLLLTNLQLQGCEIQFDDKVTGKQIDITALHLVVPVISNLSARVDIFVQPYASAAINGAHLALHGRSKPFADSLETALALDLDHLDLPGYMPFSPIALPLKLRGSERSTKLDLRFSRVQEQAEILLSGDVRLDDLSLSENNDVPLLTSRSVQAKIKQINLLNGNADIDALTIDTPAIWAALDQNPVLKWLRIGAPAAAPAKAVKAKSTGATNTPAGPFPVAKKNSNPTIGFTQLTVHNGKFNWSDDYNAAPRQTVQVNNIAVDAQQISTAPDAKPATIKLSADQQRGGHLQVGAQVTPAGAAVDGDVKDWPLARYKPYVDKVLAANVGG